MYIYNVCFIMYRIAGPTDADNIDALYKSEIFNTIYISYKFPRYFEVNVHDLDVVRTYRKLILFHYLI